MIMHPVSVALEWDCYTTLEIVPPDDKAYVIKSIRPVTETPYVHNGVSLPLNEPGIVVISAWVDGYPERKLDPPVSVEWLATGDLPVAGTRFSRAEPLYLKLHTTNPPTEFTALLEIILARRTKLHQRCRHYGGPEPHCTAGIDLRAHVGGPDLGWLRRTPCVINSMSEDTVPCDRYEDDDFEWERTVMDIDWDEAVTLVELDVITTTDPETRDP